ncbi:MAG: 4-alpha-glucanotransferase [Flavonifractor plautii]
MSPSSFAGNPFFLDLEELTREGLLTQKELDAARRADPDRVDYAWLHQTRIPLLRRAWGTRQGVLRPATGGIYGGGGRLAA